MPPQVKTGGLFKKLGQKLVQAHKNHAADETVYDTNGSLPPGIEGGVAELVECGFKEILKDGPLKGQYMFQATGIIKSPKVFTDPNGNPVKLEGRRTSIMETIADTPTRSRKTVEEHMAWVYNELRKLGLDTASIDVNELESACEALAKSGVHFTFRTWIGSDMPAQNGRPAMKARVNEVWNGAIEGYEPEDPTDGVDDETPGVDAVEEDPAPPPPKVTPKAAPKPAPAPAPATKPKPGAKPAPKPAPEPEPEPEPARDDDLDAMAELAGGDDGAAEEAQARLTELAHAAGLTDDDIGAAPGWVEVVALINERMGDATEAPAEPIPAVGEIWKFKPIDPKTKKKAAKAVEGEITAVDEAKRTVKIKSLTTNAVSSVGFDDLEGA